MLPSHPAIASSRVVFPEPASSSENSQISEGLGMGTVGSIAIHTREQSDQRGTGNGNCGLYCNTYQRTVRSAGDWEWELWALLQYIPENSQISGGLGMGTVGSIAIHTREQSDQRGTGNGNCGLYCNTYQRTVRSAGDWEWELWALLQYIPENSQISGGLGMGTVGSIAIHTREQSDQRGTGNGNCGLYCNTYQRTVRSAGDWEWELWALLQYIPENSQISEGLGMGTVGSIAIHTREQSDQRGTGNGNCGLYCNTYQRTVRSAEDREWELWALLQYIPENSQISEGLGMGTVGSIAIHTREQSDQRGTGNGNCGLYCNTYQRTVRSARDWEWELWALLQYIPENSQISEGLGMGTVGSIAIHTREQSDQRGTGNGNCGLYCNTYQRTVRSARDWEWELWALLQYIPENSQISEGLGMGTVGSIAIHTREQSDQRGTGNGNCGLYCNTYQRTVRSAGDWEWELWALLQYIPENSQISEGLGMGTVGSIAIHTREQSDQRGTGNGNCGLYCNTYQRTVRSARDWEWELWALLQYIPENSQISGGLGMGTVGSIAIHTREQSDQRGTGNGNCGLYCNTYQRTVRSARDWEWELWALLQYIPENSQISEGLGMGTVGSIAIHTREQSDQRGTGNGNCGLYCNTYQRTVRSARDWEWELWALLQYIPENSQISEGLGMGTVGSIAIHTREQSDQRGTGNGNCGLYCNTYQRTVRSAGDWEWELWALLQYIPENSQISEGLGMGTVGSIAIHTREQSDQRGTGNGNCGLYCNTYQRTVRSARDWEWELWALLQYIPENSQISGGLGMGTVGSIAIHTREQSDQRGTGNGNCGLYCNTYQRTVHDQKENLYCEP
ncbi:UNVERIFIED_CONTAM: hypothetical protein FKN15_052780 [Acipenser sinensis]